MVGLLALAVLLALVPEAPAAVGFIPQFAGPFIAYTDIITSCDSKFQGVHLFHVRVSHFNPMKPAEGQIWNGVLNMTNMRVDDSWWARVVMDVRSNNAWKENAFIFNFPQKGCSQAREHLPKDITQTIFPPKDKPCFVGKGVTTFVNKSVQLEYPHFRVMPYGHYRFRLTMGPRKEKAYMCSAFICHVIPKAQ